MIIGFSSVTHDRHHSPEIRGEGEQDGRDSRGDSHRECAEGERRGVIGGEPAVGISLARAGSFLRHGSEHRWAPQRATSISREGLLRSRGEREARAARRDAARDGVGDAHEVHPGRAEVGARDPDEAAIHGRQWDRPADDGRLAGAAARSACRCAAPQRAGGPGSRARCA